MPSLRDWAKTANSKFFLIAFQQKNQHLFGIGPQHVYSKPDLDLITDLFPDGLDHNIFIQNPTKENPLPIKIQ
jgi:hypothetical protein